MHQVSCSLDPSAALHASLRSEAMHVSRLQTRGPSGEVFIQKFKGITLACAQLQLKGMPRTRYCFVHDAPALTMHWLQLAVSLLHGSIQGIMQQSWRLILAGGKLPPARVMLAALAGS